MWWSTPENVGHDKRATNTIVNDLSSSLRMVYGEPDARSTTTLRSTGDGKVKVKDTGDGVKITYRFHKAGITIPVTYTLEDDYLEARIETDEIEEDTSQTGKLVTSLSLMSSFGAASDQEDGYFVIPDGSGALIRYNNGKTSAKSYTGYVYGTDLTAVPLQQPAVTEQVYLPMYGIVNSDSAMMVVCTEGDSNAKLTASVSGQSKSSYNVCGFDFTLRDSDSYDMSGNNSTALTVFEDGDIKTDAVALRYYPLETEDTPDYSDVANAYRNYLTGAQGVTSTVTSADAGLYLNLYGGTEKEKSILGIPVTLKNSLTTFAQAEDILTDTDRRRRFAGGHPGTVLQLDECRHHRQGGSQGKARRLSGRQGRLGRSHGLRRQERHHHLSGSGQPDLCLRQRILHVHGHHRPHLRFLRPYLSVQSGVRQPEQCGEASRCSLRRRSPRSTRSSPETSPRKTSPQFRWAA